MARQQHQNPAIKWENNEWSITLPLEDGKVLNASWKPGITYVVRITQVGTFSGQPSLIEAILSG